VNVRAVRQLVAFGAVAFGSAVESEPLPLLRPRPRPRPSAKPTTTCLVRKYKTQYSIEYNTGSSVTT